MTEVHVLHQHWSYEPTDYLGAFATLDGAQARAQHTEDAASKEMKRTERPLNWQATVVQPEQEPELWEAYGTAGGVFIVSRDRIEP